MVYYGISGDRRGEFFVYRVSFGARIWGYGLMRIYWFARSHEVEKMIPGKCFRGLEECRMNYLGILFWVIYSRI